jgi:hypothetical protein
VAGVELLASTEREFRESDQLRLILEVALVRLAHLAGASTAAPAGQAPTRENGAGAAPRATPPSREVRPRQTAPARTAETVPVAAEKVAEAKPPVPSDEIRKALAGTSEDPAAAAELPEIDLATLQRRWLVVVEQLKRERHPSESALVSDTAPARLDGDTLVLGFKHSAHIMLMERPESKKRLEDAVAFVCERRLRVQCEVLSEGAAATAAPPAPVPAPRQTRSAAQAEQMGEATDGADNSRLVHQVIEVFGGTILEDEPN